jgi:uncharacterized membrane protein
MKKIIYSLFLVFSFLLLVFLPQTQLRLESSKQELGFSEILDTKFQILASDNIYAHAYDTSDTGWVVTEFNANAKIDTNRKVNITENITADFGNLSKHGIYRYIPYHYSRNGNNYNVRIKIDSITDGNGNPIQYKETSSSGNLNLQIGNPDKTVNGVQKYKINYELERVINSFSDHDEFYWNVTGNDWPVSIDNAKISIDWPNDSVITDNICYVGSYGSANQNCSANVNKNEVTFLSNQTLTPGEGFTVVSGIKPGVIKPYSTWQIVSWFLSDNWIYLVPVLILIYLLVNYLKNGRDPKGKSTIAPEFAPPDNLRPAVLGTVYDEKVDAKDISAVIVDLAVRGYLKIKELSSKGVFGIESKDYEFSSTGKDQNDLDDYEKEIMDGIFRKGNSVKLSDLREDFYEHVKDIKDDLYAKVVSRGYFSKNPSSVRNSYIGIGSALIFLGIFLFAAINVFGLQYMVALILSGVIIIIFSSFMPKRTDKGVETTRQIKGFYMYMHTAERYRQHFNEHEKIFEKFLPYAMVFGIVKEWANAFKDLAIERPDWYEGTGTFYPILFANNMINMQNSMNSTLITPPSSAGAGGSGFSGGGVGGGFGGGGGGSW